MRRIIIALFKMLLVLFIISNIVFKVLNTFNYTLFFTILVQNREYRIQNTEYRTKIL